MKKANKNIEIGHKLFALRDTVNDKLYASIVEACRQEEVDISIEKCQKELQWEIQKFHFSDNSSLKYRRLLC